MRSFLSLALLAGLAACSQTSSISPAPPDDLVLTTDQATYAPGATATVTFQNDTDGSVSLAQPLGCVTVEREANGGWTPVPSDRMCTAALVPVEEGETVTAEIAVPDRAGTYRVSQTVYPGDGAGQTVTSPAFGVR